MSTEYKFIFLHLKLTSQTVLCVFHFSAGSHLCSSLFVSHRSVLPPSSFMTTQLLQSAVLFEMSMLLSGTWEAAYHLQPHLSCGLHSDSFLLQAHWIILSQNEAARRWEAAACPSHWTPTNNSFAHSYTCYICLNL